MTIAELHGKISSSGSNLHEKMEDLLTSDVFTACKYLPAETLLMPFLRAAQSPDGRSLAQILPSAVDGAEYRFWPMLSGCEPDLVITLHGGDGSCHLVMVEAKYLSGKSGTALGEDEVQAAASPTDQLAREFVDLNSIDATRWAGCPSFRSRSLVYITAHRSVPDQALDQSVQEIGHFSGDMHEATVYWTSWFQLASTVQAAEFNDWRQPILADLKALLERKQFTGFGGYHRLAPMKTDLLEAVYRPASASRPYEYALLVRPPDGGSWLYGSQSSTSRDSYRWLVDAHKGQIRIYS